MSQGNSAVQQKCNTGVGIVGIMGIMGFMGFKGINEILILKDRARAESLSAHHSNAEASAVLYYYLHGLPPDHQC